jgi:kynurenine formamidase
MCSPDVVRSALAGAGLNAQTLAPAVRFAHEGGPAFRHVADLTHTLSPRFPVFPFYEPFRMRNMFAVEKNGFAANELTFAEHTGTHLDAPSHFVANGQTAEALEVSRFLAPLVVVSVAERAARDEDTLVTVDDLAEWERAHGRIPDGAVVVMDSGWEPRVGQPGRFLNADAAGVMHHPGWSREAAEWLVHERVITGVGTDTISLDFGASTTYEAHQVLLGAGKYGLECVASLGTVPPCGATLVVGAPKHEGGTGGPARLLALY